MENENTGTNIVTLCAVPPLGACPTIEIGATGVDFRDDHGGHVRLTREEWSLLVAKVRQGELA